MESNLIAYRLFLVAEVLDAACVEMQRIVP